MVNKHNSPVAVLARLLKRGHPIVVKHLKISQDDSRFIYNINDEVYLWIRHSIRGETLQRDHTRVWTFVFTPEQLAVVQQLLQDRPVYYALACESGQEGQEETSEVCFLRPEEVAACIQLSAADPQVITVRAQPGRPLTVWGNLYTGRSIDVAANALDQWDIL